MTDSAPQPPSPDQLAQAVYPALGIHVPLRQYLEKTLAGMFARQPHMSGDPRQRLLPHEVRRVEDGAETILRILAALLASGQDTTP